MNRNKKGQFTSEGMKGNKFAKGAKPNKTSFKKGQHFSLKTEFKKGQKLSEETKRRIKENNSKYWLGKKGTKHPAWKGGISSNSYSDDWTKTLRRAVRERDNYICQICSKYGDGVHHIDYNKQNDDLNNLIVLCKSCHTKTNFNREIWKKKLELHQSLKKFLMNIV